MRGCGAVGPELASDQSSTHSDSDMTNLEEDLLKSSDGPPEPMGFEWLSLGLALLDVFGQQHNEALEYYEKQILQIRFGRFQALLHLLNHLFGGRFTLFPRKLSGLDLSGQQTNCLIENSKKLFVSYFSSFCFRFFQFFFQ